jgi:hypothetical protein
MNALHPPAFGKEKMGEVNFKYFLKQDTIYLSSFLGFGDQHTNIRYLGAQTLGNFRRTLDFVRVPGKRRPV